MARMASDGSVILRLPDGTIAVIPPSRSIMSASLSSASPRYH